MSDDVAALFGGACRIEADADAARDDCTDVAHRPFGYVAHEDAHGCALRQSRPDQRTAEIARLVTERLPLDAMPGVIAAHEENIVLGVLIDPLIEQRIDIRIVHMSDT